MMTQKDSELLPCPFCDEQERLVVFNTNYAKLVIHPDDSKCPLSGYGVKAILWNTRKSAVVLPEKRHTIKKQNIASILIEFMGWCSSRYAGNADCGLIKKDLKIMDDYVNRIIRIFNRKDN